MIDLKSFILGGLVVLAGVYYAIRQQKSRPDKRVLFFKREKRGIPSFSEN